MIMWLNTSKDTNLNQLNTRYKLMRMLSHHQWKLVFNAVRQQQKHLDPNDLNYSGQYQEYHTILDKLYPIAYNESYLSTEGQ